MLIDKYTSDSEAVNKLVSLSTIGKKSWFSQASCIVEIDTPGAHLARVVFVADKEINFSSWIECSKYDVQDAYRIIQNIVQTINTECEFNSDDFEMIEADTDENRKLFMKIATKLFGGTINFHEYEFLGVDEFGIARFTDEFSDSEIDFDRASVTNALNADLKKNLSILPKFFREMAQSLGHRACKELENYGVTYQTELDFTFAALLLTKSRRIYRNTFVQQESK